MSEVIEVATFTLKDASSPLPQSILDGLKTMSTTPGVMAFYFGPQLEDPTKYTWVARCTSQSVIDDFHASLGFPAWSASFRAPLASLSICTCATYTGDVVAALDSPCTEFFSSFGADDDYLDARLNPFLGKIVEAKLPGLNGGITGEFVPVKYVGIDQPEPKMVILLLGWNSRADHEAQRGEGKVIDNNIHLIRSGRKSVGMFHVNLQKL